MLTITDPASMAGVYPQTGAYDAGDGIWRLSFNASLFGAGYYTGSLSVPGVGEFSGLVFFLNGA